MEMNSAEIREIRRPAASLVSKRLVAKKLFKKTGI